MRKKEPEYDKKKVVSFMLDNSFCQWFSTGGYLKDVFTGEKIPASGNGYVYKRWNWNDELAVYVWLYNVELPQEFIDDISSHSSPTKAAFDIEKTLSFMRENADKLS